MDLVMSSEKHQLVANENAAGSLDEVCLLSPVDSRYANDSEYSDIEPEVEVKHPPHSLAEHQVQSTFTEPSGDEEFADQCLNHDLTESKLNIPCFGQDVLMHQQCLVSARMNKHDDNFQISDRSSCLKEDHKKDVTAELNTVHLNSMEHSVVNHINSITSKIDSRHDFSTYSSNEKKRHLLNDDSEIETKSHKQVKHIDTSVTDAFYETGGSHRLSPHSNGTDEFKSTNQHFYENDTSCNDQGMIVSSTSIQQTSVDSVRRQTFSSCDDRSKNIRNIQAAFDRSLFEEQIENKAEEESNSLMTANDHAGSLLLPETYERVGGDVHQVVENVDDAAITSSGMLCGREHQVSFMSLSKSNHVAPSYSKHGVLFSTELQASSVSLPKNGLLMQTSFAKPELMLAELVVPESSSIKKGGKSLLDHLKQNRAVSHLNSCSSSLETPLCKVVTKYVFINKSLKSRTNKKRFGVLYRQAFRHCHGAMLEKKKKQLQKKNITVVKENIRKKEPSNRKTVPKQSSRAVFINKKDDHRNQSREVQNKSREERRLARELNKCLSKDLKVTERKNEIMKRKKDTKNEMMEKCSTKKTVSEGSKRKHSKKIKSLENSVSSLQVIGNSEVSHNLAKIGNRIKRQHFCSVQDKKIHDAANEISSESKRRRKERRTHLDKGDIKVEEDTFGKDNQNIDNSNDGGVDGSCQQRKSKLRNRKDLTLQEKVQAIMALDIPGSKLVAVAKRFGVSVSAISRINKNRELIMLQSVSGDLNGAQRRSRECKDPELDKVLLRWYRTIESLYSQGGPVAISNVLLKEKAHELAVTMGKNYFPSDNWIIRWKNRHNIGVRSSNTTPTITDRGELRQLDVQIDLSDVLHEIGKQDLKMSHVKQESFKQEKKPEDLFICEHCGVLTSSRKKKENSHLPGCPASSVRKDLTLEEKAQVVQALEQPGVKMVTLAKKYGVSPSAISRIHKNRVDILARRASGLANSARRRDRGSKEPEVEKVLCEWFKSQHELGIHISGSMIREKARDIAKVMGKEFWPSESWVFRWRHRNNVTDVNTFLYGDSDEGDLGGLGRNNDNAEDVTVSNSNEDVLADKSLHGDEEAVAHAAEMTQLIARKETTLVNGLPPTQQFRLPRSVMCEKCGYVSNRVKNNRIKSLRHAKGCPDLKQRNELTYENRARMLKALEEPGATLSSVARQFGVSVSSMSRMNQKKEQIFLHSEDHATQKRIRDCKEPEVAYTLYQWYMQNKAEGIHVSGPKLKEHAKKIAADFGREFNASSGWLGRWRHRYNIISSSIRNIDCLPKDSIKKKKLRREDELKLDNSSEDLAQLQEIPNEFNQNSIGSSESVIVEPLEPGHPQQLPQTTPVFIHQRFQNPWEIAQQQVDPCVWAKDFLTPPGSSVLDESPVSVAYTYGDTVSKPVFHNMFDSFSAVGYQVALPLDSSVVVSREFLKPEITEDKCGASGMLLPHASHSSHSQLSHHLTSNITTQHHLHHHVQIGHPQPLSHTQPLQVQPHPQMHLSLPPASPVPLEDDPEQQRQVMEALKIMSSFAQKKSLGDHVQAALRTIEMSMKGASRKTSTRHTYTSI